MSVRFKLLLTALISGALSALIALGLMSVTPTWAQGPTGSSETGAPTGPLPTSRDPEADSRVKPGVPDVRPNAFAATFSYFRLAGPALQPRDSTTGYVYDGVGCIHRTAGTGFFAADIHLPEGAAIKYLRFYYNNVVAGNAGTMFITTYNGTGSVTDMAGTPSTSASGLGQSLSVEITHTVTNADLAYVINWIPPASVNQACGIRVAYYAPAFALDLPFLSK